MCGRFYDTHQKLETVSYKAFLIIYELFFLTRIFSFHKEYSTERNETE
nr:MAG TPA: hypothetical protein [Caudoviricetes sp.]DAK89874.1 MAG TPA: hypothetical protein [Caudoviricetes sp.]